MQNVILAANSIEVPGSYTSLSTAEAYLGNAERIQASSPELGLTALYNP